MPHALRPRVEQLVREHPVLIFMKGTPDEPRCGFSAQAVDVLRAAGAHELEGIDLLEDDALWEALEELTEWPTSPQVFIHGQFIGGCDIVTEMHEAGELQRRIRGG